MVEPVSEVVIKAENLSKRFGKLLAVAGANLEVKRGEIFGLLGPDGAGKTTTIRMLATVMTPSGGHVTIAGLDATRYAETIKQRIGYMSQQFNLYADLSVQENLDFFADIFAVRGRVRQERLEWLLHFARLTEFRKRRAGHLSGGMKKKLALTCALVHKPEILYLDEPTTGVDPVSRREFWDILSALHLEGVTIMVSTPYMDEAERCSRIGLMYRGRLVACGTPAEVKKLVAEELIEVHPLVVRGLANIRRAEAVLAGVPGVLAVRTYGDLLRVFVDDAKARLPQVRTALEGQGIAVVGLRPTQARMEEAFISVVQRQTDK